MLGWTRQDNRKDDIMSRTFLISDTHFSDDAIRRYEARPFAGIDEMNEALIGRWNEAVARNDIVYHLGDIGVDGDGTRSLREIFARLNGSIVLVRGNHDTESDEAYRSLGIREVANHPIVLDGFWILSHEPMYVSMQSPYANVFGHVHGNPAYRTVSPRSYCVSVERTGYAPVPFDDVKKAVREADANCCKRKR